MWKSIKREFQLNVKSMWEMMAIIGSAWVIGLIIDACIFHFSQDDEVFIVGLIASGMAFVFIAVILPVYYFSCGFEQAVSMGCTRRSFMVGMAVTTFAQLVCCFAGVMLLAEIESLIGRLTVGERYSIGKLGKVLEDFTEILLVVLLGTLALLCVGLFIGACFQRWGRKALWGTYVAGMMMMLIGSTMDKIDTDTFIGRIWRALSHAVSFVPGGVWAALGILLVPLLGTAGVLLLLRASVRQAA